MHILIFVFFTFILQVLGETLEGTQLVREKRQFHGFRHVNFPRDHIHTFDFTTPQTFVIGFPGHSHGGLTQDCRGNKKRRPECQSQVGGSAPQQQNCRGKNKRLPQCQNQGGHGPPGCQGRNKHLPQCQNQAANQEICFGPQCQSQAPTAISDNAVQEAFNQIPWLNQLSNDNQFVAIPGLPNAPSTSQQSRFYQLAYGARDQPFQECFTPRLEFGHCRFLQHCILPDFVQNFNIFLRYVCFIDGIYVGVCCPDSRYPNQPSPPPPLTTVPTITPRPSTPRTLRGSCGLSSKQQTKIVGGRPAELNKYPWAAALLRNKNSQYCGGVLITDKHVLTASHCVDGFEVSSIVIRLGEYSFDEQEESAHKDFGVSSIKMHEKYDTSTYENDIAVITLERSTDFSISIWPVCLPPALETFTGRTATAIGWGTIYFGGPVSPILQEVSVPVWENSVCDAAYKDNKVYPVNLCAGDKEGGKDSCQGDSGGPLMLQYGPENRWTVIGVVSWGIRCADSGLPGVYARVSEFLDWISQNTA